MLNWYNKLRLPYITSKSYGSNFYSVAKNYIKNFGICDLSGKEKKKLLNLKNQNEIDDFLMEKYKVNLN